MSTSGDSHSAAPISGAEPQTKLTTPGGSTESTMRHSSATPSGSTGAGLTTTVLPQASAGPILPAQLVIGKLYGRDAGDDADRLAHRHAAGRRRCPAAAQRDAAAAAPAPAALARPAYFARRSADGADLLRLGDRRAARRSRRSSDRPAPPSRARTAPPPCAAARRARRRSCAATARARTPRAPPAPPRRTCSSEHCGACPAGSSVAGLMIG